MGKQLGTYFEDDLFQQDNEVSLDRPESFFGDRPEDVGEMIDEYTYPENRGVNLRNSVQEVDEEVVEREQPENER